MATASFHSNLVHSTWTTASSEIKDPINVVSTVLSLILHKRGQI